MDEQHIRELRQKREKNPSKGMIPPLVTNLTDFDFLDMHYFLVEEDNLRRC